MKLTRHPVILLLLGSASFSIPACSGMSNCEERLTCDKYASGGSTGDGDGDDTETGSGGEVTGSGGGDGDGDVTTDTDTDTDTETGGGATGDGDEPQCLPALCSDGHCVEDACVPCVFGDDTKGCKDSDTPVCLEDNTCAECRTNDDCTDSEASVCDLDSNTCTGCTDDDGCQHLDTTLCDTDKNVCIECTAESEVETDKCGATSCDPATNTCTETTRGSVEVCETCLADSECQAGHHCVPMQYKGENRGGYCLKTTEGGCSRPYGITLEDRTTLSGQTGGRYCGINEDLSTCEAVLALVKSDVCPNGDADCPEGGFCRQIGDLTDYGCTYECSGLAAHCPSGLECDYGTPPPATGGAGSGGGTSTGGGSSTGGSNGTGGQKYCGG